MKTFTVNVVRSYETTVEVVAEDAEAAAAKVNDAGYPLPPVEDWYGMKDWLIQVRDEDGSLLHEVDR